MSDAQSKIVVLLGPPGSGKGTQAKMIGQAFKLPQISTGDMLREERSAGTDVGRRSSVFMDKGELVPDELILEMVGIRCCKEDCSRGYILDGFPRTVAQGEALDRFLQKAGTPLWLVLYFDVPDDEIVVRITGRQSCGQCGKIFHTTFNPPPTADTCDCGGRLIQRPDDKEEIVRKRLKAYQAATAPLIDYYTRQGKLRRITARDSTIAEVHGRVLKAMQAE